MASDSNKTISVKNSDVTKERACARWFLKTFWISRLFSHIPPAQFGRYLIIGVCNTIFGYASFATFTAILEPVIPYSYMAALIISQPVNITVAFLGYKRFVFKTKGNYFKEWTRCLSVYGSSMAIGIIALPLLVAGFRYGAGLDRSAPYVAGALLTIFGVVYNFMGHKMFSFRNAQEDAG